VPRESREGFETVFMRKNGERFPVMIYEAPLVGADGRRAGWMSAVLDISAQRRAEELSRQQQDRLQASARLATVGEMASLLSHELNQPLAAISSYAAGSLNLLQVDEGEPPDADLLPLLRQALGRIAEQAERAGRVIKSVHDFVRRREQQRETIAADQLLDSVMPLVRLQARKSGTSIRIEVPMRAPRVVCDRTMVEQVLLNLARNGIQAMESLPGPEQRGLVLGARQLDARWVEFSVTDAGPGIAPAVAERLFTPFFTTRQEGMGLGLSLWRYARFRTRTGRRGHGVPVHAAGPAPARCRRPRCRWGRARRSRDALTDTRAHPLHGRDVHGARPLPRHPGGLHRRRRGRGARVAGLAAALAAAAVRGLSQRRGRARLRHCCWTCACPAPAGWCCSSGSSSAASSRRCR
jgi:hypothetical protein